LLLVERPVVMEKTANIAWVAGGMGIGPRTPTRTLGTLKASLGMHLCATRIEIGQPIYWTGADARPTLPIV
jgi:hypothetical protein